MRYLAIIIQIKSEARQRLDEMTIYKFNEVLYNTQQIGKDVVTIEKGQAGEPDDAKCCLVGYLCGQNSALVYRMNRAKLNIQSFSVSAGNYCRCYFPFPQ